MADIPGKSPEIGATSGVVKSLDDTVLDTLEGHIDFVESYQKKVFEGEAVKKAELERRYHELSQLAAAITSRLTDIGVRIVGAFPEEQGLGARFAGVDREGRVYRVDLHLDDEQRMAGAGFLAMLGGTDSVYLIEKAIRQTREGYLETELLARLGMVRGKAN